MPTPISFGPHSADPPDSSHTAPASAPGAVPMVRLATADDAARLADWLDAGQPLPMLPGRERRAMLETLLARPQSSPCVLAELSASGQTSRPDTVQGLLAVHLIPQLALPGLAAFAAEWWCLRPRDESGAMFAFCADWLVDWCRAHGVRHLLLPAGIGAQAPAWAARMAPLDNGLLHLDLKPAARQLG